MSEFTVKRIKFRNGERFSVVRDPDGSPVHQSVLFLNRYRTKGRAANTINQVCHSLAFLHNELASAGIDIQTRLKAGRFLSIPEVERIASSARHTAESLEAERHETRASRRVVSLSDVIPKVRATVAKQQSAVTPAAQANRIRHSVAYLRFVADYAIASLASEEAESCSREVKRILTALEAHVPRVSNRARLGARVGLSKEEQDHLVATIDPDSPSNPWKSQFVKVRNWLIVVLLLAVGMRRGELLGLQIRDLVVRSPKIRIVRRADSTEDPRIVQPNTKTYDREVELHPSVMRRLNKFIAEERRRIPTARRFAQIFVSDAGEPLSAASIDKLFRQLRDVCPGLPTKLTSHVMRHSWNERFSEASEALGLSDVEEQRARSNQQGWADGSPMSATYTRRHTARKGREVTRRLQENLEASLNADK